ncbi:MAG: hypothetical protein H6625_01095 [Bdellovibrionaceae bacterium]|nr:hypothetical protein [Pseudobdellovibrionaceae bacterium]
MELHDDLILKSLGLQGIKIEYWATCDEELKLVLYARQNRNEAVCNVCANSITHVHEWKLRKIRA